MVNYGWQWDLQTALLAAAKSAPQQSFMQLLASVEVSRIDPIVRWSGRFRLSGFLPIQSVYADFFAVEALWPDYGPEQFEAALHWYAMQDITPGRLTLCQRRRQLIAKGRNSDAAGPRCRTASTCLIDMPNRHA
jgi:undecaprenyl pyrophosphate synthase